MEIPLDYEEITDVYDALAENIREAFDAQLNFNRFETEKADIWAGLLTNPDFKPGRSNLEQDAKLRAHDLTFMEQYDAAKELNETARLNVELSRVEVGKVGALLTLGKILVAIKEDQE